jgi:Flp pilus assembly protein TadG
LCKNICVSRSRISRRREHGGAAVEFALVLPIFVAIMFGMVDYGWYFYQKFSFASAIREGVRYGALFRDDVAAGSKPDVEARAEAVRRCNLGSVPTGAGGATITATLQDAIPRRAVRLVGTYTFRPLVGIVRLPSSTMTYTMQMLLEQQY